MSFQHNNFKTYNPLKRFIHWYTSSDALPYWTVLVMDCLLVIISGIIASILALGTYTTLYENLSSLLEALGLGLIGYILGFRFLHTYSGIIRFSSFVDLQRIGMAALIGMAFTLILKYIPGLSEVFKVMPPLAIMIQCLILIVLMTASRVWAKIMFESYQHKKRGTRVYIYGTQAGGVAIAKNINTNINSPYLIKGFVSDNHAMFDKWLMGVRVYPNDSTLVETLLKNNIQALIVSPMKIDSMAQNEKMVNNIATAGIKILVLPGMMEWDGKSELNTSQLREVNIEDLMPRQRIEIDMSGIASQLTGKRILITGSAGSIGSEIVRQVAEFNPSELILIDQAETPLHDIRLMMANKWPEINAHTIVADISNMERMSDIFSTYNPEYVFHAAAYKHVPMMENNPAESIYNNVKGTKIVADLSVKHGVKKFVMVSTDKAVNPTNVMGCSKRICEIYVQSLDKAEKEGRIDGKTQFVTTRFGNVLGSNGSVIPLFKKQIAEGGPVTVTHPEIIRFFMLISEACKLVLEAGTMGNGGEIFVFDMGEPVKIVDLARRMILLSGAKDIDIKFTGLRDGEKLYEEVLSEMEQTKPTFHSKIMIAQVREYEFDSVSKKIDELITSATSKTPMEIVKLMKMLVPEFKSQHSIYESLDN